jgi:uncharacterized protein (DUF433 family)
MTALQTVRELLPQLSRAEKAELLRWAVQELGDAFPGIEARAGVCGGEPCVVRTRIPVWLLEAGRRAGLADAELLAAYPTLRAEDLVNAQAYARAHGAEIGEQIRVHTAED